MIAQALSSLEELTKLLTTKDKAAEKVKVKEGETIALPDTDDDDEDEYQVQSAYSVLYIILC